MLLGNWKRLSSKTQLSDLEQTGPGTEDLDQETTMKFFKKLFRDNAGATAIEYGLIAALIAVAAITAMDSLGTQLSSTFSTVSGELSTANAAG
jgi:pilus assembly protein Flp/PilA